MTERQILVIVMLLVLPMGVAIVMIVVLMIVMVTVVVIIRWDRRIRTAFGIERRFDLRKLGRHIGQQGLDGRIAA